MAEKRDTRLERLFFFGRPLSHLYSLLMAYRSALYRHGIFRQHKLEIPVISVGNLVMGGTGKTPLVHYIAKLLQQHNRKPAVLSRGYKGSAATAINIVSNSTDILLDAAEAGDEPRLLAEKLAGIPVITGKNRYTTGRFAIDSLKVDTLILDDGFQHMALKRDLDLVLFTTQKLLGNGRVLPGGELREPLSALNRADAFVITGIDEQQDRKVKEFISFLETQYPEKPIFTGFYQPAKMLFRLYHGKNDTIAHEDACKLALYAFCGIARPESFKKTLEISGIKLTGFQAYKDHHAYSAENIESLLHNARNSGAEAMVTTEKDLVKLRNIFPFDFPLLVLPIELRLREDFDRFIANHVA
jgi:tetraacyldisaccharide 4'-kinase